MLTDRQKDILVGSLLGDGRLECRSKSGTARLRVHHADSQSDLVDWKYQNFRDLVVCAPWSTDWLDKRFQRMYRSWFFHTVTTELFKPSLTRFYPFGKKIIPTDIVQDLTPLTVAVWIMDDGCLSNNSLILNTQSFVFEEQRLLLEAMKQRYQISGLINRDRSNYRLRFSRTETIKLSRVVRPHIIESLQSKIVPVSTVSRTTTGPVANLTSSQHAESHP